MPRTKIKYEKLQRAITKKTSMQELSFLCTAIPLNEIYLPMKFQVDISYSFRNIARTRKKNKKFQRAIIQKL